MNVSILFNSLMPETNIVKLANSVDPDEVALAHNDFVALLFYVHGKHLRSCRYGQLT